MLLNPLENFAGQSLPDCYNLNTILILDLGKNVIQVNTCKTLTGVYSMDLHQPKNSIVLRSRFAIL